jgi:hypothetical protein
MSKKRRKGWRASVQRQNNNDTGRRAEPRPHQLRGLARREWIDKRAQEMFEQECGADLAQFLRTCQLTSALYEQQVKAIMEDAEAPGPNVTPYENRMSGSLAARMLREKRTWLRDCRQRLEEALQDEAEFEEEHAEAPQETGARSASDGLSPDSWMQPDPEAATEPAPEEATLTAAANETSRLTLAL